ncbi:fumarylacetoacetate hydrolase family protein [Agromyces kandeliae]|uniref:FAA hydrolase family protein n=1 Tax=Agromyces kandeliae TaxID=2666141 RepID=A0A6L5R4E3_9MICO|nr:fumarylacetoacetate hydrolase family protein [Agromyces kandeliae]MRX44765.1 FAA hydrolase family protein [Agromyces kandeliae]
MRTARAVVDGSPRIVVKDADGVRVAPVDHPDDALQALESVASGRSADWQPIDLEGLELLAPVAGAGKIIAVGLNYVDHTAETGIAQPERPLTFAKYATSLTGPASDVVIPDHITQGVDFEAELALLIGRRCGGDTPATLEDVAAYTVANDVSARDVQFGDVQWTRGKSFDTFTPLGPWLVAADEFGDPSGHRIYAEVDGELLQEDDTAEMIFDVPTILAFVSDGVTLEPGDLVLTGTPAGAGGFRTPPRYLQHGQTVVVGVEGIGELRNRFVHRSRTAA